MGRRKKYLTEEDRIEALKKRQLRYVEKNRSIIYEKNRRRYSSHKQVIESIDEISQKQHIENGRRQEIANTVDQPENIISTGSINRC